jgi:hypothetical protein
MKVNIYERAALLPDLPAQSGYFHSRELMETCERTPRQQPYMAVVTDDDGLPLACLLAVVSSRRSWLPPYLYKHVRIMGEGGYREQPDIAMPHADNESKNALFSMMVDALTKHLGYQTLYMEVSNLSQKMFGYGPLRAAGFFPVRWMNIHISLHSHTPEERISGRLQRRIERAMKHGVTTKAVENDAEFRAFMKLLRRHHWLKPRRYVPNEAFFRSLMEEGRGTLFITQYGVHVIGCSCLVYTDGDAYLWYSASRRKSYAALHPNAVTYWNTIRYAHKNGCQHIRFVDVGLPYRRNPYRDFILRFGGKEVSTFRWFRCSIKWVNALLSWIYRD